MITVLAGGVGAARFLRGLVEVVDPKEISVIVNTADDFVLHGLAISPDLDTVMYTLADDAGEQGWGRSNESWQAMKELHHLGSQAPLGSRAGDWFNLGDRDLATHLYRTQRLAESADLTCVTQELCRSLDLGIDLLPMTNDRVATLLTLESGEVVDFQEYFVRRHHDVAVFNVEFDGADSAKPSPHALAAIESAERVIIAPSNPILSIGPILAIDELRAAMRRQRSRCLAISPLIAGRAVKGPADHLMTELGHRPDAVGVADMWREYASHMIIDTEDRDALPAFESLDMSAITTDTLMTTVEDARRLAMIAISVPLQ
jgi:LPPG:FO 2-phospho-L-lactate transferase